MVTLQQLRYFREVAKNGHLTRTAENLYIAQTTLSNTMINLERQLGVKLFDRVGRTLQLSEAGKRYYTFVNEALIALENAQAVIDDYKEQEQQSVSVAMTSSNIWADLIQGFRSQYRDYHIRQIGAESAAFREMLLGQEIDFVITGADDILLSGLESHLLREEKLFLCVPQEHRLAERDGIFLEEAKEESFVSLPKNSGFREFCDHLFQKAGLEYHGAVECDYTLRGKLVEAGFGVAITTQTFRDYHMLGANVAYVPILDDFARRPIALIWNPRHYLSRAAEDFRKYAIQTIV